MMSNLRYTELSRFHTFEDRFDYLKLKGVVGESTFGFDRHMNQSFYHSAEWRRARRDVIARDLGCDLGVEGHEIRDSVHIHHMNPMTVEQVERGDDSIFDPEFLISVTLRTHNAIHFGDASMLPTPYIERRSGDTRLW